MQNYYRLQNVGFQKNILKNNVVFASTVLTVNGERIIKALELLDRMESEFSNQQQPRPAKPPRRMSELARRLLATTVTVDSSWIDKVGWDAQEKIFVLYKADGETIAHKDVDQRTAMQVLAATSIGSAWNRLIKGQFTLIYDFDSMLWEA